MGFAPAIGDWGSLVQLGTHVVFRDLLPCVTSQTQWAEFPVRLRGTVPPSDPVAVVQPVSFASCSLRKLPHNGLPSSLLAHSGHISVCLTPIARSVREDVWNDGDLDEFQQRC